MKKKAAPATPAAPVSKYKRLTPKQWAEAEALWESGEVTIEDLKARTGKTESSIMIHFRKKGIKRGSKAAEHKEKVKDAVAKAVVDDATVLAARIRETKEEHYKMAAGLAKLTWAEILKTKQDNVPVAVAMNNLKALDNAMNVLKKAREERFAVLGLDKDDGPDDDGLPELVISELTADQVELLRSRDHTEFDELDDLPVQDAGDNGVDDEDGVVEEGA